ncbi:Nanos 1 [Chamberlinius hualienensis]
MLRLYHLKENAEKMYLIQKFYEKKQSILNDIDHLREAIMMVEFEDGDIINSVFGELGHSRATFDAESTNENGDIAKCRQLCVFCRSNGETFDVYTSHNVRNIEGKILCPQLRSYTCPLCQSTGDYAHTVRYCPKYKHKQDRHTYMKSLRKSNGKRQGTTY